MACYIHESDLTKKEPDRAPQLREPQEEEIQTTPEVHLATDEIPSKKTFTKGQRKHVVSGVKEVQNADKHMWGTLRTKLKGCRAFLLEVFTGTALLSMMAAEAGYAISQPCDILLDSSNLLNAFERAKIEAVIDSDDPYCVRFSPVCGPWSPLQQLSVAKGPSYAQKLGELRKLWYSVCKWIVKIIRQRVARGRQVLFEQPWPSKMWQTLAFQRLLADQIEDGMTGEPLTANYIDQCEFGLKDEQTGLPHKKPTGIMTASQGVKHYLNRECSGDHQHQPLEGGNRTKKAQCWPHELCRALLQGLQDELEHTYTKYAFPAEFSLEEEQRFGTLDRIYNPEDEAIVPLPPRLDEVELHQEESRDELAGCSSQDHLRRQEWKKLPLAKRVAVRRLHQMTGHASSSAMARMLKLA